MAHSRKFFLWMFIQVVCIRWCIGYDSESLIIRKTRSERKHLLGSNARSRWSRRRAGRRCVRRDTAAASPRPTRSTPTASPVAAHARRTYENVTCIKNTQRSNMRVQCVPSLINLFNFTEQQLWLRRYRESCWGHLKQLLWVERLEVQLRQVAPVHVHLCLKAHCGVPDLRRLHVVHSTAHSHASTAV